MESTTQIFQDSELKAALLKRGETTSVVGMRDRKRYYALLNHHLLEIALTTGEASFLCEALKNYRFKDDPEQAREIWKHVAQGIQQESLDHKWSINDESFVHKL